MGQSPYKIICEWLSEVAGNIRDLERKANNVLYEENNEPAYRELMRAKAFRLSTLAEDARAYLEGIDERDADFIMEKIERFSKSASMALEVDSPFFMSAILYPDDYKDGDENDLETFISIVSKFDS